MDLRKIKAVQIFKEGSIKKIEDGFAVQSQNSKRYYFVNQDFKCTCPDCQINKTEVCKHSQAVKYYLGIEKLDGTTEKVRLTYKQAWSSYNQAQNTEVNMFDKLLRDLVETVEEPERIGAGRPSLPLKEQLFCSTQKVYSQLSSRRAKSLFNNAQEKGLLKKSPHSNAVNKFFNREDLTQILKKLIVVSSAPLKSVETKFAVDSTGFRTTNFNEYCKEKHKTNKRHHWVKLHAVCGVKTNVITSAEVTRGEGTGSADSPQFIPLANQTKQAGFNIQEFSADKAYSSRDNLALINEFGGTVLIPFKKNASPKPKGKNHIWRKMFHYFQYNQEEFMKKYHARSNIETTFHMIKSKFGDSIKSKNPTAQQNELLAKVVCHNIVVLIHEMFELGIEARFN